MVQDLIVRLLSPLLAGLQPVIVAAFTAAITVGLTFWYRRQYERRQALVALKAEIFQNNQRLKGFARECHQMDLPFVATPEATTTPYFDTTAYENYRNNGYLFDLHPYDAGAVSNHYNRIKFINRQLQRRDEIYYNLDGEVKGNVLEKVEEATLLEVGALIGEDTLKDFLEDDHYSMRIKKPMMEGRNANTAFKTEGITVDNLITIIDRELDSDPFIVQWLIDSTLYNDPDEKLRNVIPTTEDVHEGEEAEA
jgi:hypothetical protein